jgi:hypothetical protein
MRRVIAPLAMASAACTLRPWTPSVAVAYWAQDVPDARATTLPTSQTLQAKWQLPPGSPWALFTKPTLLTALDPMQPEAYLPDVRQLDVVGDAQVAASRLAGVGLPDGTLWIIDLRGAGSVAFAAALGRQSTEAVAPVLTFNNWPAPEELIPAEETLAALLTFEPRSLPEDAAHPVFMLDAWRLAYRFDTPDEETADNRYMLGPNDFPTSAVLREHGIRRVVYVVENSNDTEKEEDDLHATLLGWQSAGIALYLVDLAFLVNTPAPPRWDERLASRVLVVAPRFTLVDDPAFYARARGGFGGVYARPLLGPGFHGRWLGGSRAGIHGGGGRGFGG